MCIVRSGNTFEGEETFIVLAPGLGAERRRVRTVINRAFRYYLPAFALRIRVWVMQNRHYCHCAHFRFSTSLGFLLWDWAGNSTGVRTCGAYSGVRRLGHETVGTSLELGGR